MYATEIDTIEDLAAADARSRSSRRSTSRFSASPRGLSDPRRLEPVLASAGCVLTSDCQDLRRGIVGNRDESRCEQVAGCGLSRPCRTRDSHRFRNGGGVGDWMRERELVARHGDDGAAHPTRLARSTHPGNADGRRADHAADRCTSELHGDDDQPVDQPGLRHDPDGHGWVEAPIDRCTDHHGRRHARESVPTRRGWVGSHVRTRTTRCTRRSPCLPGRPRLALKGFYEVRTQELFGVYDRGKIELVQPGGTLIQQAFATDNTNATTA